MYRDERLLFVAEVAEDPSQHELYEKEEAATSRQYFCRHQFSSWLVERWWMRFGSKRVQVRAVNSTWMGSQLEKRRLAVILVEAAAGMRQSLVRVQVKGPSRVYWVSWAASEPE